MTTWDKNKYTNKIKYKNTKKKKGQKIEDRRIRKLAKKRPNGRARRKLRLRKASSVPFWII